MTSENPTSDGPGEGEETEAVVEHVAVAETTTPPPAEAIVAVMTPASTVQPSSFITGWRGAQWIAALLALLLPLALMAGLAYVFRDALRAFAETIGVL